LLPYPCLTSVWALGAFQGARVRSPFQIECPIHGVSLDYVAHEVQNSSETLPFSSFCHIILIATTVEMWSTTFPQEITHKRVLKDCDEEFKVFLTTMEAPGEKLGPLLFQFGKFDKYAFKSLDDFLARLGPFLKRLPKEHKFAVEFRNKDWLVPKLADVLREHGVALTLIDQGWMPRPWEMKDKFDLITSDFTYVRLCLSKISKCLSAWELVFLHNSRRCSFFSRHSSHLWPRSSGRVLPSGSRTWLYAIKSVCSTGLQENAQN